MTPTPLQAFKLHLEEFLDPLFRSLTCGNRLCEAAAGRCIGLLRDLIGVGVGGWGSRGQRAEGSARPAVACSWRRLTAYRGNRRRLRDPGRARMDQPGAQLVIHRRVCVC